MKRLFKYTFAVLAGVMAMTITSCTEEYEYDAPSTSAAAVGGNFFLSADATSFTYLPTDEQSFSFVVNRVDSTKEETVTLISSNAKFTVAPLSFAAGEKSKKVVVNFDIPSGSTEVTTIAVDSIQAFIYGASRCDFKVTRFKQYTATFVMGMFQAQYETPVYQVGDGKYMIPVVYETDPDSGKEYAVGYEEDIVFTVNAKKQVFVDPHLHAWYNSNYGYVGIIGNADEDAKVTETSAVGSGLAGTYDAENKMIELNLYHFVPNLGAFGTFKDYLVFSEEL